MIDRIALDLDVAGSGIDVSTVGADGMLVRYPETCIFLPDGRSEVIATYDTRNEAIAGHRAAVAAIRFAPAAQA